MVFQQCQTARAMSSLPSGNGVGHRAARAVLPVGGVPSFSRIKAGRAMSPRAAPRHWVLL